MIHFLKFFGPLRPPQELHTQYRVKIAFSKKLVFRSGIVFHLGLLGLLKLCKAFRKFCALSGVLWHFEEIAPVMPLPIMGNMGDHVGGQKIHTKLMKIFFPLFVHQNYTNPYGGVNFSEKSFF